MWLTLPPVPEGISGGLGAGEHFVAAMGLEQWSEGTTTHGRAEIRSALCAPGSEHPRIGVLATMVDLVAGSQPEGPINPTVDLRLRVLARPRASEVHLRCEVLRVGRTLFVGQTLLFADADETPFATSVVTFMNRPMTSRGDGPIQRAAAGPSSHVDDLLAARFDGHTAELDPLPGLTNGPGGTIQGGVLALLAELLAERALALDGPMEVVDLDIRYLNRVKVGPVRATAEVVALPAPGSAAEATVQVKMTDIGDGGRLTAYVCATARHR
jgi:acyl-coenzyme A thioesterase PaaI-like protein